MSRLLGRLVAPLLVTVASGCVHYPNLAPCRAENPGAAECYESSAHGPSGKTEHRIHEEVLPGRLCDRIELEQVELDPDGRVRGLSRETRECGALLARRVETYDASGTLQGREVVVVEDVLRDFRRAHVEGATPRMSHARARWIASRP